MTIAAIIPAYNESAHIASVVQKAKQYVSLTIVVDDGSADHTGKLAQEQGAIVVQHKVNLGKGAALKTGCDYALLQGASTLIVLDADGQHDPAEIPAFLQALHNHDLVFSYRDGRESMPLILQFGNRFINLTSTLLFSISIKDTQCGYRAFTAESYRKIRWAATDYFMESEMIIRAGKHKLHCTEVPIKTIYSDNYKGTTVVDGLKIVAKMLTWKVFR